MVRWPRRESIRFDESKHVLHCTGNERKASVNNPKRKSEEVNTYSPICQHLNTIPVTPALAACGHCCPVLLSLSGFSWSSLFATANDVVVSENHTYCLLSKRTHTTLTRAANPNATPRHARTHATSARADRARDQKKNTRTKNGRFGLVWFWIFRSSRCGRLCISSTSGWCRSTGAPSPATSREWLSWP